MTNHKIIKSVPVLLVFLIILVPVIFKGTTFSGFRYDASLHANMPTGRDIKIANDELMQYRDKCLLIDMGPSFRPAENLPVNFLKVNPESVLLKENFRKIRIHKGPVILAASEPSVAARVWMILKQKGIKDLYILAEE
jgi:hypothetical protein